MSNLPVVSVSEFTEIIKMQMAEHNNRAIFGLGKGGIGKTESIFDLATKELKIGYKDIRLLTYSEVDLKGIPFPNADNTKSVWLQNDVLPRADRDGENGILVLDEITSVARSVRTAAYQLLNERKLGEYELPKDWMIVCLGNGEEDGGDFQGMEGNFANRCSVFNVIPDITSWKEWAYQHDVNPLVIGYVNWRPEELHTYDPKNDTEMLFASPRSWEAVSNVLNAYGFRENDNIISARVLSNVGMRVGNQFLAFCKYKNSAVSPEDILAGRVKNSDIANAEVLYITMQSTLKLLCSHIKKERAANNGSISVDGATFNECVHTINWVLSLKSLENQVICIKEFTSAEIETFTMLFLNSKFRAMCPAIVEFSRNNSAIFKK